MRKSKLGNASDNAYSAVPSPVVGLDGIVSISAGVRHSLALRNDGTVWAWGRGSESQLGNGAKLDSNVPVQVVNLSEVSAIAAGGNHNLALKKDGTALAWGWNADGQLGNGTTNDSVSPVRVLNLTGVSTVAAGFWHSLAIRNDGTVWAWGRNINGALGDGTTVNRNVPARVAGISDLSAVSGGGNHSLALKNDGTVHAWGSNASGQLGDGSITDWTPRTTPIEVPDLMDVLFIAAGFDHNLAVRRDGSICAWGSNYWGELGNGTNVSSNIPVAVGSTGNCGGGSPELIVVVGPDQTILDDDCDGQATVVLNAAGSYDTGGAPISYTWTENGATLGTASYIELPLTVGEHLITLTVTRSTDGAEAEDSVLATVRPADECEAEPVELTIQPGEDLSKDCLVATPFRYTDEDDRARTNFDGDSLWAGYWSDPGRYDVLWRSYLQFDLSDIPTRAAVIEASIGLYRTGGNTSGFDVHEVTAAWSEGAITWNSQPSFDPSITAYGSILVHSRWGEVDITSLVQKWVSEPVVNYGVVLNTTAPHEVSRRRERRSRHRKRGWLPSE